MYSSAYLLPQVSTKGLLAHWKLWDGFASSTKVFDYSLNGNLGTTTMITYGSYPGFLFAGSQINCGSATGIDDLFSGGASFSCWARPTGQGVNNGGRLVGKANAAITTGWGIYCNASDTELTFVQSTDTTDGVWTFLVDITGDVWQHIVCTYDSDTAAAGGGPTVYVDGVAVVVTESAAPDDAAITDATSIMYIGQNSAGNRGWAGKIDDVMFFNRILPATEAKSIYGVTRERYGV